MDIIAKHLDAELLSVPIHTGLETVCAFSGKPITQGILLTDVISDNFTDYESVRHNSQYVSIEIAKIILPTIKTESRINSLRVYSYLATESELRLLKTDDFLPLLENPPEPPFVLCISFSNKKHIAYKARVNYSRDPFYVSTDKGNCEINNAALKELLEVAKRWYTIIPGKEDSSLQPTYFTKDEIFSGNENAQKVLYFGHLQYLDDLKILKKYRKSLLGEIVKISLKKQIYEES